MLHFIAGLPRSGSTLLTSLLSQNPRIHGAAISGLSGIFNGVFANWEKDLFHVEQPNLSAKRAVLRGILDSYFSDIAKPVILDKNRQWILNISLLEEVLGRKVKMVVSVRPIVEILASFESIRLEHPLELTGADAAIGAGGSTVMARADYFAAPNGVLGMAYNGTKDAVVSGYLDRLLFVDYNKFMSDPERGLVRVYDFLEESAFEHDFSNIKRPGESNWRVHQFPGLHDVRPVLERSHRDAKKVLGEEVYAKYYRETEPWDAWT